MSESFSPPAPEPPTRVPEQPTLRDLLVAHGQREVPAALERIARLAAEAHAQRWRDKVADRDLVNRSTALWAVLAGDPDVALAAAEGNLSADILRQELRITVDPSAPRAEDAEVDPRLDSLLAHAIEDYLERMDPPAEFDVVDLASAILLSVLGPGGLLPGRVSKTGADVSAALDSLSRLRSGTGVSGFSRTVREARRSLGPERLVTAADVIQALGKLHPTSALARVSPDGAEADRAATDWWLAQVRAAYDPTEVLRSPRGIVDAELTLRALVDLEPSLARSLEGDPEITRWIDAITPRPTAERKTEPSADVPAKVDLLGRTTLAATLARQLELIGQRGESSLLIHLDGPWGSGKSSLLGFLRAELSGEKEQQEQEGEEPHGRDYLVVEVNAWREQRVGAQWWTLYRALRAAHLEAATSWRQRLASRAAHMWDVVVVRRDKLWPVLLSIAVVAVGLWLVVRFGFGVDQLGVPQVLSVAAVTVTGLTAAYRFLAPVSPRSARAMVDTSTNPMAEVRDLFGRSLDRAAPRPVIFLIDDLDRCEPDYVIRFLEVVQTLVRDAPRQEQPARASREGVKTPEPDTARRGPYAVIAADGGWLRSCYQKAYGELVRDDPPGKPLGYRFLEKIFQMHIRLPNVEEETKQKYYESLLFPEGGGTARPSMLDQELCDEVSSRIGAVRSTDDLSDLNKTIGRITDPGLRQDLRSAAIQRTATATVLRRQLHELTPFAELLEANPRTIRLFVNAVSMQAYLRFLEGASFEMASLALWAVVEARWPALADHLREHPEDVLIRDHESQGASRLPPDLLELLTGREVESVLHSQRWPAFDPERVRTCTGARVPRTV